MSGQPLPPGSSIGILGGGQLGRMAALAAAPLGYLVHVYSDIPESPAAAVSHRVTVADYRDEAALAAFADAVDAVTLEFENIPLATLDFLTERLPVRPGRKALAVAQDRIAEKTTARELGLPTAAWHVAESAEQVAAAVTALGGAAIVKAARFGYDGKAQLRLDGMEQIADAWASLGTDRAIVEEIVPFRRELSIIAVRAGHGASVFYPLVENRHEDHILRETIAPAPGSDGLIDQAREIASALLTALDYVGVLAVELFETEDGRLLVNEIAPRPHNSGHWTIEGAETSQFEQQIRALCNLPLGAVDPISPARMRNLLGEEWKTWRLHLADPHAHLHLYGKADARPGRKMGHVTWVER